MSALERLSPPLVGFVLTFAVIASPMALAVTWAVLGPRLAVTRMFGTLLASLLTAIAWRIACAPLSHPRHLCAEDRSATSSLALVFIGVIFAAACAAVAEELAPAQMWSHLSAAGIAAIAAVLSSCSASDPFFAAALLRDARHQLAFMLAAQGASIRQFALIARSFGMRRAVAGLACSAIACAAVVWVV